MVRDLTNGTITKGMLLFSLPMIVGNLLQQLYNIVDTIIVGKVLGAGGLAAVGSAYALMVFLTSISLGFCMGGGVVFARLFGARRYDDMKVSIVNAFAFIGIATLFLTLLAFLLLDRLLLLLNIQPEIYADTRTYLVIILCGIPMVFIYNFFTAVLRSIGNSLTPLFFLGVAALTNIILDILFVLVLGWGIAGAALATVFAQSLSAVLVLVYFFRKAPEVRPSRKHMRWNRKLLRRVAGNSVLTSVQQSIMNLGILMIQGLVNSFGVAVMAAFAAAVKIDSFAYMPVQDFGNAFATYIAQNHGAGKTERIHKGIRCAVGLVLIFCIMISLLICLLPEQLMLLFVKPEEVEVIAIGALYLRIEGAFYCLIGCLFLLYGFYRGLGKAGISVFLTVISLGTRVCLAYILAAVPAIGLQGIWWAIPIGWLLADITGFGYYLLRKKQLLVSG